MAKDRKKLQHIHSSVLNKIPNSGVLLPGEIAVNTNPNNEFLSIENAGGNTVRFSSDLQLVDWMERKEVIPSEGEVVNKNLATNESEIKVTLNQKVGDSTPSASTLNQNSGFTIDTSSFALNGGNPTFSSLTVTDKTDLSGNTTISNGDGTGTRTGHTLTINTTDVIAEDENWTETITNKNSTVGTINESATKRTTIVGTENLTVSGTTTETHTGNVTINNKANVSETTDGNLTELIKTNNYRDVNGDYSGTTGGTTTEVKNGNLTETNGGTKIENTAGQYTQNNNSDYIVNTSGNTLLSTSGNTTIESYDTDKVVKIDSRGNGGDVQVYAKDNITATANTITVNSSSNTDLNVGGNLTEKISGNTNVTVSGTTTIKTEDGTTIQTTNGDTNINTTGSTNITSTVDNTITSTGDTTIQSNGENKSVTIQSTGNGGDVNVYANDALTETGKTVTISGLTSLTEKSPIIDISGTTTSVTGRDTLNLNGNTINETGNTVNISGSTSVTVKGATVTESGTTLNQKFTTINVNGKTINQSGDTYNVTGDTNINGDLLVTGDTTVSGKTVFGGEVEFKQPVTIDLSACLTSTTIADGICEAFDRSVVTIERDSNPSDSGLSAVYKLYQDGVQITNSAGVAIDINVPKDGFLKNVELVNVSNTYYLRFTWNIYDADTQTYTTGSTDVSVEDLVKDIAANNSKSDRGVNVDVWYNESNKKMNVSADTTVTIKNNGGSGTKTFAKNGGTHTLSAYTLSYSHNGFSGKFDPFAANSSFTSPHSALTIDYGVVVTGKTDDSYDTSAAKTVSIPTKLSHITSAHTHPSSEITDIGNGKFTVSGNGTAVASTSANASANSGVNIVGDNLTVTPDASNKKITVGLTNINSQGTYKRVVVDAYGRVTSGDSSDANTNYYTTGLTVTTATTTSTINVKGNNAAVSGSAVISAATTSRAGVMTSTDKTKLNSITSGATKVASSSTNGHITIDGTDVTVYTHPTSAGNKHIPSGGSSGQFLGWSAAGTAAWVSNPNTDTATTYNGHYTPSAAAGGTKSASASGGGNLTWGSSIITGVTISGDAKGHYTAVAVSSAKLPSNPNTDSATTLNGHYTPSAAAGGTKSASASGGGSLTGGSSVVTGVTLSGDAKGHVTAVAVSSAKLPNYTEGRAIDITNNTISLNLPISAGTGSNAIVENYTGNTASGSYSHAEGYMTLASGYSSHAEGQNTIASGSSSHAEGQSTTANGSYSHAEGYTTTASGEYSHAEGERTIASGSSSHAEGQRTIASGSSSHAEGNGTIANGSYSHAEGNYTVTNNQYEHASGQWNASNKANTTFGHSGNTLFSVGNGTADNARHNAFEIRQNGDTYINGKCTATAFYASSDINLKHDINDVNAEEIAKANTIQFKSFKFNNDETDRKVYGVIAQEVQNANLNELVHTADDGMLSVDYTSLLILKIASLEDYCKKLNDRILELENKQ